MKQTQEEEQPNRIVKVTIAYMPNNGQYGVEVFKEFAPENGGGVETFKESAPSLHRALDVARSMVTFSPATNYGHALAKSTGSRTEQRQSCHEE